MHRHRQTHVLARLELGDRHLVGFGRRRLRADAAQLLPHDWIRRTDEVGVRHVAGITLGQETANQSAHLRVAFFVAADVGAVIREGPHRSADVGQREAGQHFAVRHVLGRIRHRHRQLARADARFAGGDPERRAAADRSDVRTRDRDVIEDESRRMAFDHAEIREVRARVADEKIVDVVLARVDAGGERGPRRRRFGRMRRAEFLHARAAAAGELRHVRQLTLVHPFLNESRIHAVEAEDDELLMEFFRRPAASARDGETNDGRNDKDTFHRHGMGSARPTRHGSAMLQPSEGAIITSDYARPRD